MSRAVFAVLCLCLFLSACGVNGTPTAPTSPLQTQKVQHVVVIMQENRSFDNLFHGFPGVANLPYSYVPQRETVPYWTLAKQYTLGDRTGVLP